MSTPAAMPRQPKGKAIYVSMIILFLVAGFILQFNWIQRTREQQAAELAPGSFADKLGRWMLEKKGLDADALRPDVAGVEQILCEACLGTGKAMGEDGKVALCPICQGVGFHAIRRFDAADRICPNCAGMGRAKDAQTGEVGLCPRCDGRGLIRSQAAADALPNED